MSRKTSGMLIIMLVFLFSTVGVAKPSRRTYVIEDANNEIVAQKAKSVEVNGKVIRSRCIFRSAEYFVVISYEDFIGDKYDIGKYLDKSRRSSSLINVFYEMTIINTNNAGDQKEYHLPLLVSVSDGLILYDRGKKIIGKDVFRAIPKIINAQKFDELMQIVLCDVNDNIHAAIAENMSYIDIATGCKYKYLEKDIKCAQIEEKIGIECTENAKIVQAPAP